MICTKNALARRATNAVKAASFIGIFLISGQIWAADVKGLDTGLLADWFYTGVARETGSKASCRIQVSKMERDYAGRFYQLFHLIVPGKPSLSRTLELKQVSRIKSPSYLLSKKYFSFSFEMREVTQQAKSDSPFYKVEMVGETTDPSVLDSLKVYRRSRVQEPDILLFDCVNLSRQKADPDGTNSSGQGSPH